MTASEVAEMPCVLAVPVSGAVTCRCPASSFPFRKILRALLCIRRRISRAIYLALMPCAGRCICVVLLQAVWGLAIYSFMINDKFSMPSSGNFKNLLPGFGTLIL